MAPRNLSLPVVEFSVSSYLAGMSDYLNISDFLMPVNHHDVTNSVVYKDGQIGKTIEIHDKEFPDLDDAQIVLVGCGDQRGGGLLNGLSQAPDIIRRHFYQLFYWHQDIKIADVGNIKSGSVFTDSYAALKTVVQELMN